MRILNMQKRAINTSHFGALLISFSLIVASFTGASYVHAQDAKDFQELTPATYQPQQENLVYLQSDQGLVIVELAPFIAPNHVAQFKALVNEGFYNGLDFYRVIDVL